MFLFYYLSIHFYSFSYIYLSIDLPESGYGTVRATQRTYFYYFSSDAIVNNERYDNENIGNYNDDKGKEKGTDKVQSDGRGQQHGTNMNNNAGTNPKKNIDSYDKRRQQLSNQHQKYQHDLEWESTPGTPTKVNDKSKVNAMEDVISITKVDSPSINPNTRLHNPNHMPPSSVTSAGSADSPVTSQQPAISASSKLPPISNYFNSNPSTSKKTQSQQQKQQQQKHSIHEQRREDPVKEVPVDPLGSSSYDSMSSPIKVRFIEPLNGSKTSTNITAVIAVRKR